VGTTKKRMAHANQRHPAVERLISPHGWSKPAEDRLHTPRNTPRAALFSFLGARPGFDPVTRDTTITTTNRIDGLLEIYRSGSASVQDSHPLSGNRVLIGRNADASVFLDHATVSRPHAELVKGPFGRWWIRDLGSTNGTFVNGSQVRDRMVSPGDEIRIGLFTLRMLPPERPRLASLPPPPSDSGDPTPKVIAGEGSHDEPMPLNPRATPPMLEATGEVFEPVPPSTAGPPRISADHLSKCMALGRQLLSIEDAGGRLREVCRFLVGPSFPGTSAMALRLAETPRVLCGPEHRYGPAAASAHYSRSVLDALRQTREPILASNSREPGDHRRLTLPADVRPLAVVACPLWDDATQLDALYVELPGSHGTEEWRTLVAFVADAFKQAELVWEMRRHVRASAFVERELEMARLIQDGLVPQNASFDHVDLAIGYQPCRWVGGDYVDAVPMPDGRILLAIADVCGKGLQAALVCSSLHTMVHAIVEGGGALVDLVQRMNRYLCNYLPQDSFVTMAFLALEPESGAIECVNAGHPPPLALRRDGTRRPLQAERNVALGIMDTTFEVERTVLAPDEVLLLYTDGLTELSDINRNLLGTERLGQAVGALVAQVGDLPLTKLKDGIVSMLDSFRGSQLAADDTTFMLARRLASAAGRHGTTAA
jgi:hypothetical protein